MDPYFENDTNLPGHSKIMVAVAKEFNVDIEEI